MSTLLFVLAILCIAAFTCVGLAVQLERSSPIESSAKAVGHLASVTDAMHALLVKRTDELMGCVEYSPKEAELAALTDVIEAYEAQRWPEGKTPAAKANRQSPAVSAPFQFEATDPGYLNERGEPFNPQVCAQ